MEVDDSYLNIISFSKSYFSFIRKINKENIRIWGLVNLYFSAEHIRGSLNVNVSWFIFLSRINCYWKHLLLYVGKFCLQLQHLWFNIIFQKESTHRFELYLFVNFWTTYFLTVRLSKMVQQPLMTEVINKNTISLYGVSSRILSIKFWVIDMGDLMARIIYCIC